MKAKQPKKIGSQKGTSGETESIAKNAESVSAGVVAERSILSKKGYLAASILELKKVSFPTKEETIRTSIWTVLFVLFFSLVLAVFDLCFQYLMKVLLAL